MSETEHQRKWIGINSSILKALKVIADNSTAEYVSYVFINFEKDKNVKYIATDGHIALIVEDNTISDFDLKVKISPEQADLLIRDVRKRGISHYIPSSFDTFDKSLLTELNSKEYLRLYDRSCYEDVNAIVDYGDRILDTILNSTFQKPAKSREWVKFRTELISEVLKVCKVLKIDAFGLKFKDTGGQPIELEFKLDRTVVNDIRGVIMEARF